MLISTETGSLDKFGDTGSLIALISGAGFDAYDYTMFSNIESRLCKFSDYAVRARELRAFAEGLGIKCNQAHAPFPTMRIGDSAFNSAMETEIKRAIEIAAILGAKVIAVHPVNDFNAEQNAEQYSRFENLARGAGIKIGVENMWNWPHGSEFATPAACSTAEDFKAHLDLLAEDVFVALVDIGHAEMKGAGATAPELINAVAGRLRAIHLHDNDKRYDLHKLPFLGCINFGEVIDALAKAGYCGDITLETVHVTGFPAELLPSALSFMRATADYFRDCVLRKQCSQSKR